jgi:hypothetical protein
MSQFQEANESKLTRGRHAPKYRAHHHFLIDISVTAVNLFATIYIKNIFIGVYSYLGIRGGGVGVHLPHYIYIYIYIYINM